MEARKDTDPRIARQHHPPHHLKLVRTGLYEITSGGRGHSHFVLAPYLLGNLCHPNLGFGLEL